MSTPDIELTDDEKALFAQISFDFDALRAPGAFVKNGDAVCALMKSLIDRNVIPEVRKKWFTNPEYYPNGRGKSRKQLFERGGNTGEEILRHGNFLAYLRYFVCGPQLPQKAQEQFRNRVADCGMVTSGDIPPLSKLARDLTRSYRLNSSDSEEFYKLALDCGLGPNYAPYIRDAVKSVR